jgi:hypothetical protein
MAVKLIDLQVIYGIAGAREQFEDLASQLVLSVDPRADKVREKQGDGGIDVYIGDMSAPDGIDVYQCKFFAHGIGESQKQQIRESFKRCQESKRFTMKKWTLCLPVELSFDEKEWFAGWKNRQASTGVVIEEPWGAVKLEQLLYQDKNKGLKEAFFKEEHLTQIREMHGMMQELIASLASRLQEDAETRNRDRQTGEVARQADEIDRFVRSLRETYLVRLSQAAGDMGFPSKRPAHWEIVIRPGWIPADTRIKSLRECWDTVEACRVTSNGWEYPVVRRGDRQPGQDWAGITKVRGFEVESWRLSQKGLFAHMFPIWDDVEMIDKKPDLSCWDLRNRVPPQHFLDIDVVIRTFTHVFRFAAKLAERAFDPGDGAVDVSVRLNGTRDRALMSWIEPRRFRHCYQASEPALEHARHCPRAELLADPDPFALTAADWFLERFGWHEESAGVLAKLQKGIFSRH